MKKKILSVVLALGMVLSLAACGGKTDAPASTDTTTTETETKTEVAETEAATEEVADPSNGELVDGKFAETRHITVEVYDRGNDGGSDPTNNKFTDYVKSNMMEKYNVEVEYVAVPRWTEVEEINNLLASGSAPDICLTYDYATIQTYADMGGVQDLSGYVEDYKALLPNLWAWLGETNIYWDKNPDDGTIWALEGKLATSNRVVTFIRKDWLEKLNLSAPTTKDEFYQVLCAFRDNADTLLGADASKMVPYSVSYDVGWRAATLIESFIDPDITDEEFYVNGFDDRKLTENGTKEAMKLLNQWYNEDLMWKDFAIYGSGDTTEDDMMKSGYVGAFTHNWDYPFRNGEDSINANLQRLVGEDACFMAIDPFEDSKGGHTKYVSSTAGDRKIFFPITNDEPLASMLFLDFISSPETIQYMQIGDEGINHNVLEDGAVEIVAATGNDIQNSGYNIDYTMTCNGLHLMDDELTAKSLAHGYACVDPALVEQANAIAKVDIVRAKNIKTGTIEAESGQGPALGEQRNIVYDTALAASVDDFDSVWEAGMAAYLGMGGQAIMDERQAKWDAAYGDATQVPEN